MRNALILLPMVLLALCGCGREEIVTDGPAPLPEPPDASVVIANCAALQEAVERFADENGGVYPDDVEADISREGNTVLDLLPDESFENPFTGDPASPVRGIADDPGEVAYQPVDEGEWRVGYVVSGFGANELVATLSNLGSAEEAKVIANCFVVKQTAEAQYEPYIGYPYERVCHPYYRLWLPHPLVDPYTGLVYQQLVPRAASARGEIGYVAIVRDGVVAGYVVTGYGDESVVCALSNLGYSREEALVAAECRRLQIFVEHYADAHGSLYPEAPATLPGVIYGPIMMNGWNVGYRITGSAQGAEFVEIGTSSEEAKVRLNCLLVKQAVEEFAAHNGGAYPEKLDAIGIPGGRSALELMPRAHMLENSFTGMRESPVDHSAIRRGEIGYTAIPAYDPGNGNMIGPGCVITGYIRNNRIIAVTNLGVDPIAAIVMSHCRTLQLAVEAFAARNDGIFPGDIGADCTPYGETVTDLLPAGCMLPNPMNWCNTEPVDGHSVNCGEIGYVPNCANGYNRGYTITGTGREDGTTVFVISKEPRQ